MIKPLPGGQAFWQGINQITDARQQLNMTQEFFGC
jgi:hypothetical protein